MVDILKGRENNKHGIENSLPQVSHFASMENRDAVQSIYEQAARNEKKILEFINDAFNDKL